MSEFNYRNLLYKLGFDDTEIDELVEFCPKLEIADTKRIATNISLLIEFGYPECDLKELLNINPKILIQNNKKLIETLKSLGPDIEEILKSNPNII